jgi:hypothetical protein
MNNKEKIEFVAEQVVETVAFAVILPIPLILLILGIVGLYRL